MATLSETFTGLRRYIGGCLEGDLSARQALAAYRAAGGEIRTEDFLVVWRDEQRKREPK